MILTFCKSVSSTPSRSLEIFSGSVTFTRFNSPQSPVSNLGLAYLLFGLNLYSTPTEIAKFTSVCVYFAP